MKRARFTEDQIIGVLKEHEAGAKTADLARKHGVSEATLYNWKAKYGGMDVSEAKRLKQLEDENAKLKKLLAEQMLDAAALRELLSKNERKRFGYRRLFVLLRQEGEPSGINRIYRLYREEGLTVRKRGARRRAVGSRAPILVESKPNARWSVDFVHDQLACGRRLAS